MRNIVLIHLESLNYTNYKINGHLCPTLRQWGQKSLFFTKYFATATSTMMIWSDLAYGSILQYEACSYLNEKLKKYCNAESFLDGLKKKGYQVKALGYPQDDSGDIVGGNENFFIGYETEMDVVAPYGQYLQTIEKAMTKESPFAIWTCNYISNVSFNCFMENVEGQTGIERWESGYRCMDSAARDIMELLEKKQLLESTSVIFYGDHGDDVYAHGKHNGLMHAIEPYESLIHTPLFIYDSRFDAGEIDALVSTTDIRDLVMQMLALPEHKLGRKDLLLPQRKYVFARNAYAAQKVRENSFHKAYSLTDGSFLFLAGDKGMELYHIGMDSGCQHNLLDYFDFDGRELTLNQAARRRMRYHFSYVMDEAAYAQTVRIFHEFRARLMKEVESLYQSAECEDFLWEIDFQNIHYGWAEHDVRERAKTSLYAAETGIYEEFDIYGRYLKGKRVLLYGAGNYGKYFYENLASQVEIVAWVDQNYKQLPHIFGRKIEAPACIESLDFDILFVAIRNGRVKKEVTDMCVQMGVAREKIY